MFTVREMRPLSCVLSSNEPGFATVTGWRENTETAHWTFAMANGQPLSSSYYIAAYASIDAYHDAKREQERVEALERFNMRAKLEAQGITKDTAPALLRSFWD